MNFPPIFCLSLPVVPVFGPIMPQKTILGRECSIRGTKDSVHTGGTSPRGSSKWFWGTSDWFPAASEWFSPSPDSFPVATESGTPGARSCRGYLVSIRAAREWFWGSSHRSTASSDRFSASPGRIPASRNQSGEPRNRRSQAPARCCGGGGRLPFPSHAPACNGAALKPGGGSHGPVV